MLITELRDAYRESNKTFEFSLELERMKDDVRITFPLKINQKQDQS